MSGGRSGNRPKQLAVISGKGGTGKTSIVASLAALVRSTVMADCDVDAADLHLLLSPTVVKSEIFKAGKAARIDGSRCDGCGLCASLCRFEAILAGVHAGPGAREGNVHVVDPSSCEGCGLCALVCPQEAVELFEPERGEWFVSETRHGTLVHARLGVGAENSGKLVTLVRQEAAALASDRGVDLVLIDGPPGIGCAVIASVTGVDLVLVVTEATVSGLHDLKRVGQLVRGFDIPLAVCVNRYDVNVDLTAEIALFCRERGIPLVGKVPFDRTVVLAQMEGKSVVEDGRGSAANEIRNVWAAVARLLEPGSTE